MLRADALVAAFERARKVSGGSINEGDAHEFVGQNECRKGFRKQ
jgi:hypothetical protein